MRNKVDTAGFIRAAQKTLGLPNNLRWFELRADNHGITIRCEYLPNVEDGQATVEALILEYTLQDKHSTRETD